MPEWSATLIGRPISKKNSKQIRVFGGRKMVVASDAHERWKQTQLAALLQTRPTSPFTTPLHLELEIHCKGRLRLDIDNALTSVMDLLQDARVIENDDQIVSCTVVKSQHLIDWLVNVRLFETDEKKAVVRLRPLDAQK